jgi:hypothetical protein
VLAEGEELGSNLLRIARQPALTAASKPVGPTSPPRTHGTPSKPSLAGQRAAGWPLPFF